MCFNDIRETSGINMKIEFVRYKSETTSRLTLRNKVASLVLKYIYIYRYIDTFLAGILLIEAMGLV